VECKIFRCHWSFAHVRVSLLGIRWFSQRRFKAGRPKRLHSNFGVGIKKQGVIQINELLFPFKAYYIQRVLFYNLQSAHIRTIIKARGISFPNITSKTFAVFKVDQQHHLISLVSMIGKYFIIIYSYRLHIDLMVI
jgi:hypothetical protein